MEVLRHIHEITEENISTIGLGVAELGVDIKVHTADYIAICSNLRKKLENTLAALRSSRLPEARDQAAGIEELISLLGRLIEFPNIVQIPRVVEKVVEKERIVMVPTKDQDSLNREIASTTLIEKLVEELKRVNKTGVNLQLDDEVKNIFFLELRSIERMDDKLKQFSSVVLNRFRSLGSWTEEHSHMLNNFLQERFLMAGIVKESNDTIALLKRELEVSEASKLKLNDALTRLSIINVGLKNSLEDLIDTLRNINANNTVNVPELNNLLARSKETLRQLEVNALQESRFRTISHDTDRIRVELRNLQTELESYRGGETQRNTFLSTQVTTLRSEVDTLKTDNTKLRRFTEESKGAEDIRDVLTLTRDVDTLNRSLETQKEEFDRTIRRLSEEHQRQLANYSKEPRVLTSTVTDRSQEEEKLRGVQRQLEDRVINLSEELNLASNTLSQSQFSVTRLENENKELKRRIEELRAAKPTPSGIPQGSKIEEDRLKNRLEQTEGKVSDLSSQLNQNMAELSKSRRDLKDAQSDIFQLNTELKKSIEEGNKMKKLLDSGASTDRA